MSEFFSDIAKDVTAVSAVIETDVGAVVSHYQIIKGLGEVALSGVSALDPSAAKVINEGIAQIDRWIAQGASAVDINAPEIITTTQAILAAAAPAITAVTSAATTITE